MEKNLNPLPAQGRDPFCSHSNTPFEGWATPGQRRGPGRPSHLVRGCLTLLDAYGILFVVGKHDQANEAAYAEDQLLAREDRIAGAAKEARVKGSGGINRYLHHVPESQKRDSRPAPTPLLPWNQGGPLFPRPLPYRSSLILYSQYSSLLRAGAKVALHLGLVHPKQREHHEDAPDGQGPEGVPHKRVWI